METRIASMTCQDPPAGSRRGLAHWQRERATALLLEHLDAGIEVSALAQACALSRSDFTRKFKVSTGLSPHAWLRRQRVEKAKRLLMQAHCTLAEIGLECGFFDQAHFCRTFSQLEGITPRGWQRQAG
ncbi:helix-turn-helix domain-containing protein [Pseudomonas panipatensis]|uniref:AraC-type DNA-binding protein n=1 Tax=Pseudomonas panipatensis TaxID=428992 RepID=A0A1G8L9G6_9PSED|nr:AraC family transcriptional regulator [Pseudomonas panipatensis]SDI52291.1 AraC-type DNA-binding protein [Pseudomonas panipatensis]SMP75350.1 AraC-type DNA-binding protein [Pseudomonas panipatensis]